MTYRWLYAINLGWAERWGDTPGAEIITIFIRPPDERMTVTAMPAQAR
jgi:hypothetical protein